MSDFTTNTRAAHAKINLALSVGPPDAQGMHPIASWMAPVDLADEVRIERLTDGEPSRCEITWADDAPRPSPIDWPSERDLAVRAHRLLEDRAGRPLPVRMHIHKRIPVGGGLGGGSSDAAAAMLALNDLFALGLAEADLVDLSRTLGSDIAFFLDTGAESHAPRPAIVTGLGDRVERVSAVPAPVTLIFPAFGCPTGPVYRAYDALGPRTVREADVRALAARAAKAGAIPWRDLFNDLAEPAASAVPAFAVLLDSLRRANPASPIHVSGSGSTVFSPSAPAEPGPDVVMHDTRLI